MKKIFIFLFSLLLFISIPSCKKKNKDIPKYNLIEKQFIIDETKEVKYPSMNDEIDQILLVNIKNTYDVLKDNYNSEVNITYESHLNDQYVSYIFHYYYLDNQIIKTYNFDLKTNRQIDFHTQPLIEKINQMLTNHYVLTEKDIGFLQSMIIDSKLHVYVSSIITNDTIQEVVFDMDRNLIAEDQNNENSKSKKIAITFDDGPSNKSKELVDLLEELDIVATFFILGCNASKYKEELKYIYAHGHEIGNHSYSHPDFKKITIEEMEASCIQLRNWSEKNTLTFISTAFRKMGFLSRPAKRFSFRVESCGICMPGKRHCMRAAMEPGISLQWIMISKKSAGIAVQVLA